jgi:hypothetical protein
MSLLQQIQVIKTDLNSLDKSALSIMSQLKGSIPEKLIN